MSVKPSWWRWFLGIAPVNYNRAIEILRHRYVTERQHADRFAEHAQRMRYPQFRQKLLKLAEAETEHARMIGEKISLLGGELPQVIESREIDGNNWQCLLRDLEEERQCSGELLEQIQSIQADLPQVAELLERIYKDGAQHRDELRAMLMRSDPQAL